MYMYAYVYILSTYIVLGGALVSVLVAGSNPAEDSQGYVLFGEIPHRNQRFLIFLLIYAHRNTFNIYVYMCVDTNV